MKQESSESLCDDMDQADEMYLASVVETIETDLLQMKQDTMKSAATANILPGAKSDDSRATNSKLKPATMNLSAALESMKSAATNIMPGTKSDDSRAANSQLKTSAIKISAPLKSAKSAPSSKSVNSRAPPAMKPANLKTIKK